MLGRGHYLTAVLDVRHQVVTTRIVKLWHPSCTRSTAKKYVALRYEDGEHHKLVIRPEPFLALKNDDDSNDEFTNKTLERYYTQRQLNKTAGNVNNNTRDFVVNTDKIFFMEGTVVECIGLRHNTNLNGQQGVVIGCDFVEERYTVKFGETCLGMKLVPRKRLMIVFTRAFNESM